MTVHEGGIYVAAGGLEVDLGGITSNSGVRVNSVRLWRGFG
jgi:hypothetical protein